MSKVERQVVLFGMDGKLIGHMQRAEIEVLEHDAETVVLSFKECGDHLTDSLGDVLKQADLGA